MRLVIAEKNQAAQQIASALGPVRRERVRDHPVYLVGRDIVVVPLRGHIVETDFPEAFNDWRRTPLRALATAPVEKRVTEHAIAQALRLYGKDAREIVVATDFDAEGELIGLEAVEILRAARVRAPVRRARMSALAPTDVREAFSRLVDLDVHLAAAGEARQVVDLAWGAVLTRFVSLTGERRGKDFLSVGRVQTPTLALVVDRERAIAAFEPEPFWEVSAKLRTEAGDEFDAQHEGNRFADPAKAAEAHARASRAGAARATRVERREAARRAPAPFNTTSFLAACARVGVKPSEAARVAEQLYTEGMISYPRTDNETYPPSTPFARILDELSRAPGYGDAVARLSAERRPLPTRGKKETTDHPPIHPVAAPRRALNDRERRVYGVVADRFLATLAPDARVETTTVRVPIGGEPFRAQGTRVVFQGWLAYEPRGIGEECLLPEVREGAPLAVLGISNAEKRTEPPPRWTQAALVKEMERLGLGTKSTRAHILENLYARRYVEGDPARPTAVAFAVIDALRRGAPEITSPEMTATLERGMERVARAEMAKEALAAESGGQLVAVVDRLEGERAAIREALTGASRRDGALFACPACGRDVVARKSRAGNRFAGCSGFPACNATWPLPQRGTIKRADAACAKCAGPALLLVEARARLVVCAEPKCGHREKPKGARAPRRATAGASPRRSRAR